MHRISLLKRNKFKRLLRFGLYTSLIFTIIFFIDTNDFYLEQVFFGFLFGILIGLLEEITSHRRYVNVSLPLQFLVKFFGILFIIAILMAVVMVIHDLRHDDLYNYVRQSHVSSPPILSLIVAFTVITYFQIEKLIGKNMLINYLKGYN